MTRRGLRGAGPAAPAAPTLRPEPFTGYCQGMSQSTYTVHFDRVVLSLAVTVQAEDEDQAADLAHERAEEYLQTVYGSDPLGVAAGTVGLDGVGADRVVPA